MNGENQKSASWYTQLLVWVLLLVGVLSYSLFKDFAFRLIGWIIIIISITILIIIYENKLNKKETKND